MRQRMLLAVIALMAVPQTLVADSDAVMTQLLNVYTNTTDPQILETQRRGGVTLGRVSARTGIATPNLISYSPPSISGGCSGIDLYGGSFSFINKDEMTQALRAIASNAVSYAFTLAMESVCPSCMQKMESLRDQVDEVNAMMRDSCHWATSLVDSTGLKEFRDDRMAGVKREMTQTGVSDDDADAETDTTTEYAADVALTGTPTPSNVVWAAMLDTDVDTWFGAAGDAALREVLMSVTGSVVKTVLNPGGAACDDGYGNQEYCYADLPSLLTVDDFIDGDGDVSLYDCDTPAQCLNPSVVTDVNWEGFSVRIREILFGPGGNDGLLFKRRAGNIPLTAAETAFLTTATGPLNDILNSAVLSEGSLVSIGAEMQNIIATMLGRQLVLELIFTVEDAFLADNVQMGDLMRDKLVARQREFDTRTSTALTEMEMINSLMYLRQVVAESMVQREEPTNLQ